MANKIKLAGTSSNTFSVGLQGATISSNNVSSPYTLTLPANTGANAQVLTTDGAGNLTWTTVSGGGGGDANYANFAGTIVNAAQPNITSTGTLTSLDVSGDITASRIVSNVATGTAPFTVTSTTQVANLRANSAQFISVTPNTNSALFYPMFVSGSGANSSALINTSAGGGLLWDNSNGDGTLISPEFEGRLVGQSGSNTYVDVTTSSVDSRISGSSRLLVNSTGANITGNVNATTSINSPRFVSNVATGTSPFTVTSTTRVANLNVATAGVADSANSVAVANVTGIGNIAVINLNGNGSQVLAGNGVFIAQAGGTGTPGGSNTQIQFNNDGSFGGISTVTYDGTNISLGAVTTVKITGGSSSQVLSTDGTGNLSWVSQSGGSSVTDYSPSFLLGGM